MKRVAEKKCMHDQKLEQYALKTKIAPFNQFLCLLLAAGDEPLHV
jgi:hypothetical protein